MKLFFDLEFNVILEKVCSYAASDVVKQVISACVPTSDISEANRLLDLTGEAVNILASRAPDLYFDDIRPSVKKAKVGAVLTPSELLKIAKAIGAFCSLRACVSECDGELLKDIVLPVRPCDELKAAISGAIESESEIKDSASEKLYSIRKTIRNVNAKLKERLDGYTRQSEISKYLRDNIVTMRGGRYVLPVRSDSRSHVKGLVHDVSATGATVFIEPFAVVETNNELITLKTEEQAEIERILIELGKKVVYFEHELLATQDALTQCGVVFAKAEYAKKTDSYRPILNDNGRIALIAARHPLIDVGKVVPVDIDLGDRRVLLISGPNTGGKTVALKTVGLFSLMAASGMFIPAGEGSAVSVFDDVYCDIGDAQSIAQSLSTFSAHITNLTHITSRINGRSLVLLDEVGDGTDPDEGAALAIAVIKKLLAAECTAVVTTHFNAVKEFALANEQISNACMQFDNVNFRPTYRLLQGVSGSSYALEIAEKLGLDGGIIRDARAALSKEKVAFDKIMREAELMRNGMLEEMRRCAELTREAENNATIAEQAKAEAQRKLKEINDGARAMIKRAADEYAEQAEEIIEQIKEQLKHADEAALFNARKAARKLGDGVPSDQVKPNAANRPADISELTVGTAVYIAGLDKSGVIAGPIRGNKAVVAIGSIKTEVPVSSLMLVFERDKTTARVAESQTPEPISREVMMLGMTVDEATAEIDRIISDIPPRSVLRIVHGKGTGALGKGIQAFLKRVKKVKSFRYGRYGEGDTGVTIVEIK